MNQNELQRYARLVRDFPGLEQYVNTLFFKHPGVTEDFRLQLLWGFKNELSFQQFRQLVRLIHCPDLVNTPPPEASKPQEST